MPVKLGSKSSGGSGGAGGSGGGGHDNAEARIEIIPLIDIMFFLLASFMLVSLSMVNLKSVKVSLPTATTATPQTMKDIVDISVDRTGSAFLDRTPMAYHELVPALTRLHGANPNLRVFISADQHTEHGNVIRALDAVRAAGIDKVAFETRPPAPGSAPAPR